MRRAGTALLAGVLLFLMGGSVRAGDWVVDSVLDTPDASRDGVCDDGSGACTLRAALEESDGNAVGDRVQFAIPGPGPHVIALTDSLPDVNDSHQVLFIDGTSQPGYAGQPLIELDASAVSGHALRSVSGHSQFAGLSIHSAGSHGVVMAGIHFDSIWGCWIGLDASGTVRGNGGHGVLLAGANHGVGGLAAGEGNVIVGNLGDGVHVEGIRSQVLGNLIGTDGARALGNLGAGVRVLASDNVIGDVTAGNVIAGNADAGIVVTSTASGNQLTANLIGTDASGLVAIGNLEGVVLEGLGNTVGPGNVISGNTEGGVRIDGGAGANALIGNAIGLATDGAPLGNGGDGVRVAGDSSFNQIGGAQLDDGNRIAHNGGAGVVVASGRGNRIGFNGLSDNGDLGIDLGDDGVPDPADPLDADSGPNDRQNAPQVASAATDCSALTLQTTLSSIPDQDFELAWFASSTCDPSGFGEGARPIGVAVYTTDVTGQLDVLQVLPAIVSGDETVTATATDPDGNTSELSACVVVTGVACPAGCGDGVVDSGEDCDASGMASASCDPDCTYAECGDGYLNPVAGEECDDNNTTSGDGCSATCAVESCIVNNLPAVSGLTVTRDVSGDLVFRWAVGAEAVQYHVNRVTTKDEVATPWRWPRGRAFSACITLAPDTECTAAANTIPLSFYQVLAACGASGDEEGPP